MGDTAVQNKNKFVQGITKMRCITSRIFILSMIFCYHDIDQIDPTFIRLNKNMSRKVKNLANADEFSLVEIDLNRPCRFKIERCSEKWCGVKRMPNTWSLGSKIDLRNIPKSYSPHGNSSAHIWKKMYKISTGSQLLNMLLSGLHFSTTIHISSSFFSFFGGFLPNSLNYLARYKTVYKKSLYVLYVYVRTSLHILCRLRRNDALTRKSTHIFRSHVNTDKDFFDKIKKIYNVLNCLECDKCKVWGKVQVFGILSASRLYSNGSDFKLSKKEIVCLLRLFSCLCASIVEMKRLESLKWRYFTMLMNYRCEIFYILVGLAIFCVLKQKS